MIRRITLLLVVMAIPVLTALGTQQLARTTAAPTLPTDPVSAQSLESSSEDASTEPDDSSTDGPRSGSVADVVPGSVDEDGEVTEPGMPDDDRDDRQDDADSPEDADSTDDADDRPETGTVDR